MHILETGRRFKTLRSDNYEEWYQNQEDRSKNSRETALRNYGYAKGLPMSRERKKQCQDLLLAPLSAFHKMPSFQNDRKSWIQWFLALQEGAEILTSAMRRMQLETCVPVGDLNQQRQITCYVLEKH